jgi:hypothetical protein
MLLDCFDGNGAIKVIVCLENYCMLFTQIRATLCDPEMQCKGYLLLVLTAEEFCEFIKMHG